MDEKPSCKHERMGGFCAGGRLAGSPGERCPCGNTVLPLSGRASGQLRAGGIVIPDLKATNPKDVVAGNKIPLWLLSPIASAHWALAQFAGMLKYGAWNWRVAGVRQSVYISAMKRHIDGLISGEEFDPIDGTRHEANIMACAAILLDARAAGKLTIDSPPRVDHRHAYAELEELMATLREQYRDKNPKHYTIEDTQP